MDEKVAATDSAEATDRTDSSLRPLRHVLALDGVRGLAIVLVLLHHNIRMLFPSGFAGVDVFFVLSGFLITSILLHQLDAPDLGRQIGRFYIRRCLRLFPALFAMLAVFAVFTIVFERGRHLLAIAFGATYTTNWASALGDQIPGSLQHLWSLAQEEQFYLVWPLFLIVMMALHLSRVTIMIVTAVLLVIGPATSIFLWLTAAPIQRLYFGLDTHSTGILLGCLIGQLYIWRPELGLFRDRRLLRVGGIVAVLLLLVFSVGLRESFPGWVLGVVTTPLFSVLAAVLLIAAVSCDRGVLIRCLRNPVSCRLGMVSYSLYLWHIPVIYLVARLLEDKLAFRYTVVISIVLAYLISELSYRFVEQPFLKLKSRFEPAVGTSS